MSQYLEDGQSTLITFANAPNIKLLEMEVTPPSVEGGGANDVTTMRNTVWRTKAPKKLKTLGDLSVTARYDPTVYNDIVSNVNVNQLITVTFPDNTTIQFWGWINDFKPNALKEGDPPNAVVSLICSNRNNSGQEVAPAVTAG